MKELIKEHGIAILAITGLLMFSAGFMIMTVMTMPLSLMYLGAVLFVISGIIAFSTIE